jgi:hypothetical protein
MRGRFRFGARVASWCSLTLALASAGCRPQPVAERQAEAETKPAPAQEVATVLTGSIRLAEGQPLPQYRPEDMERRVLAHIQGNAYPDVCSPAKLTDRTPVQQGPDGKLIGVMVAASEFSKATPRGPRTYDVTIKDCRLTPRIVVGQLGDTLRIQSEVQYPLLPTYGSNPYNETLMPGQTKSVRLDKMGVDNVLCGFTAPCGRADVIVVRHPVYAVTDETGNFRIENFPPDETIKVSAWHPLFNESNLSVKVGKGETKHIELSLTPLPPKPETPPPAAETPPAKPPAASPSKGKTKP